MNTKESLECVENEIIKYQVELKQSIFDEILCSGILYGSALSSAFLYSILIENNDFEALPYAVAFLIASLFSYRNHSRFSYNEEIDILKELKQIKRKIMLGDNPLENMTKDEFEKKLVKK